MHERIRQGADRGARPGRGEVVLAAAALARLHHQQADAVQRTDHDGFSLGIQVLEPGAHIRRHAHERQHEVLFCYAGEGWAEVDGARHEVRPETTLLIGRAAWHTVHNTGTGQMRLLWMIAPAGLEDWFRAIGRPRRPGDAMPAPFERPGDVAEIQARQRFVREGEGEERDALAVAPSA